MSKKLATIFSLLFILFGTSVFAQGPDQGQKRTPEERAAMQTSKMKETLNLTPDQEKTVAAINLKYAQKAGDAFKSGGGGEDRRAVMQKINADKDAELKGVLTADQFTKYQAARQNMRPGGGGGRPNGGGNQ